jgi:hypothetical protein
MPGTYWFSLQLLAAQAKPPWMKAARRAVSGGET